MDTDSAAGTELLESCRDADGSLDELARLLLSLDLQEASASAEPRPAAGYAAAVRTGAETVRSSKTFRLRCAQCHQAPLKGFGQAARAVIKIPKDCRLAVLFLRCFI